MIPLIEIAGLTLILSRRRILDGISFSLADGEYLSVLGPNGAGKSSLLKCLLRILKPDAGSITVMGRPIGRYRQRDLARLVSYVPQGATRHVSFSVGEFVLMGRYPHLSPFTALGGRDLEKVRGAMELTGTTDLAGRRFDTLSGGEQQLVFIAAAIAQEARLIMLDEPTTFLDPRHASQVRRILGMLHRDLGMTVLNVTHDINLAASDGDRVVILKEGRVVHCGRAGDIMNNDILEPAYGKRFHFASHPVTGGLIVAPDVEER